MAQRAFLDLYLGLKQGRFPELHNRHHLLALLGCIILRDTLNHIARSHSRKNGDGRVRCETDLEPSCSDVEATLLDLQAQGRELTPLEQACLRDEYNRFMNGLDDLQRQVADRHLCGQTAAEIAAALGRSSRSVERWLALIHAKWRQVAASDEPIS
jgi:DNA-directed RNA polymerase specialized sigma24 family protein